MTEGLAQKHPTPNDQLQMINETIWFSSSIKSFKDNSGTTDMQNVHSKDKCAAGLRSLTVTFLFSISACSPEIIEKDTRGVNPEKVNFVSSDTSDFQLNYITCGLGSNLGALMPNFIMHGQKYTYELSQNSSWSGSYDKKPELLAEGNVRSSSLDSIKRLIAFAPDTSYYNSNPNIMSGVYQVMSIETNNRAIEYQMLNGYDTTVAQIVTILNSNLPSGIEQKLCVFGTHLRNK